MIHHPKTSLFASALAMVAFCGGWSRGVTGDGDATSKFKITSGKHGDAVEVRTEKDKAIFDVKCPFGISQMVVERNEPSWPKAVVLRLRLKGLENVKASNGTVRLEGAASIRDGKPDLRLWKDGDEKAILDEKSPFWIGVRILGGDGNPAKTLPLKDGFFELTLPAAFLAGNPKSFSVSWIDFYRN